MICKVYDLNDESVCIITVPVRLNHPWFKTLTEDEKFHLVYFSSPSRGIFTAISKNGRIKDHRKKL